jgi:hypothetical protein
MKVSIEDANQFPSLDEADEKEKQKKEAERKKLAEKLVFCVLNIWIKCSRIMFRFASYYVCVNVLFIQMFANYHFSVVVTNKTM